MAVTVTALFSKKAAAPAKKASKNPFKKAAPKKAAKKVAPKKKAAPKKAVKKVAPKKVVRKAPGRVSAPKSNGASQWYGADRRLFLPAGLLGDDGVPAYLTGELAGDYGYDPLGLGKDVQGVENYRAFELIHARWAMLGCLGAFLPELLNSFGDGTSFVGAVWWQTGAAMLDGGLLKFFGAEIPLPLILVAAIEVALLGGVETFRSKNEGPYFGGNLDTLYPGEKFDPLGLADDPETFAELRVKEIKNGRLALVSFLGYAVQAGVTGEGPYANWIQHVSDPFGYNLFTVIGNADRVPTL